jgi:hypothetical protein
MKIRKRLEPSPAWAAIGITIAQVLFAVFSHRWEGALDVSIGAWMVVAALWAYNKLAK